MNDNVQVNVFKGFERQDLRRDRNCSALYILTFHGDSHMVSLSAGEENLATAEIEYPLCFRMLFSATAQVCNMKGCRHGRGITGSFLGVII